MQLGCGGRCKPPTRGSGRSPGSYGILGNLGLSDAFSGWYYFQILGFIRYQVIIRVDDGIQKFSGGSSNKNELGAPKNTKVCGFKKSFQGDYKITYLRTHNSAVATYEANEAEASQIFKLFLRGHQIFWGPPKFLGATKILWAPKGPDLKLILLDGLIC